ncbi:MFS transporter [Actinoallomurus rhizosphaericola]|uniref:MFS transporter n=1 Tax=Actinoallomurus rhizosphaericola TaxID=2952536 RepID=UPI002092A316|nr:MFS transporter [Actinoallomurus rhizosphaericola]MCO5999712.1 MFS transporter [Actinoallomurus rhizosphaericola]
MTVEPYRRVLAIPGVRTLLLVGLVARIPVVACGLTLTLYVVGGLGRGFMQAGLVGAASTAGVAVGAPIAGRFVDRRGLRPVLVVTTLAQLVFWTAAPFLSYWPLFAGAFVSGVLALPVFTVVRQCVAAAVPAEHRRSAYALDSMLVEVAYMTGPALAVAVATAIGSSWTMALIGIGLVGSGAALLALDPPIRVDDEPETGAAAVRRREWLTPALFALLGVTAAATFVLAATELGLVAVLKADSATRWTGLVLAVWGLASMAGGFVYGALARGFSPLVIVGGMAALTVPMGLAGHWGWLCLALLPAGVMCAPAISTTIDTLSRWVPAAARGEATGLHGTAMTLGLAVSGPLTGVIIDGLGTRWAFAISGTAGLLVVLLAAPAWRRAPQPAMPPASVADAA